MVFFALTQNGLVEILALARNGKFPVWCGQSALQDDEQPDLQGIELCQFNYEIDDAASLEGALETIAEHHPGQRIWVEHPTPQW